MISIIAAIGKNRELGLGNKLLWKLPDDMRFFKQTTMGKLIVVGRKTYESFGARPLPGRPTFVISSDANYPGNGATVVPNLLAAINMNEDEDEIMIIGGASIYEQAMDKASRLYLTEVAGEFEADTWFPSFDKSVWKERSREHHEIDAQHEFAFDIVVYERSLQTGA